MAPVPALSVPGHLTRTQGTGSGRGARDSSEKATARDPAGLDAVNLDAVNDDEVNLDAVNDDEVNLDAAIDGGARKEA
ncbi:MAG TPA: hypothetical protein VIG41_12200 [Micrococcaceae bacterium]